MYHGIILRNVDASLQGFIIRNLYDDSSDLMPHTNTGIMATSGSQNQFYSLRYTGYGIEVIGLFQDLGIGIHVYNTEGVIKDTRMEGTGIGIQQMEKINSSKEQNIC